MSSLQSRLLIFGIQHSHLLKGKLKRERVDRDTDLVQLRRQYEAGALKFGSIPAGIEVTPLQIGSLYAEWIHSSNTAASPNAQDRAIFYTHGGGYVSGNCADHRMHVAKFVRDTGVGVLLYDYRVAPEHPFPAAMDDTLAAYRWLLAQGVKPANILIAGESAGGGLCLASLLAFRDSGLPLPAAGVAISPWTDLKCSGASYKRNARRDISTLGSWETWNSFYAGENDPGQPWISPIYGDPSGLPPLLIEVGDHEILLDDACGFAANAESAGVAVRLHVWEGMVHCFPMLAPMLPEATQAWEEIIAFIREQLHLGVSAVS
jgi:Esterase/lipase